MNRSRRKLVANIGMTIDEVRRLSSLKLSEDRKVFNSSAQPFDFEIAGSPKLQFKDCQYYLLRMEDDGVKLAEINIGVSPKKYTWPELIGSLQSIQRLLIEEEWKPARYKEGASAEELLNASLAGKAPSDYFNAGYAWGKGAAALTLSAKRLRKADDDEDPAKEPDFICYIKIEPKSQWESSSNPFGHKMG